MIAVIGLGNIGLAIGRRLVIRGRDVVGVDLSDERRQAWRAMTGLDAVAALSDVGWDGVEEVLVVVRLTHQAEGVLEELGALPGDAPLTCFLITTLEPEFARGLDRFNRGRVRLVELPVSGGEISAMAGRLTAMAAGPLSTAGEALLRDTLVTNLIRFDRYGEPTLAKLLNNVTGAYNARALADMVVLAHEHGLDPRRFFEVILTSSGGSWMATGYMELLDGTLNKDVRLLRDALGGLPEVSLAEEADLEARLAQARALLGTAT